MSNAIILVGVHEKLASASRLVTRLRLFPMAKRS